MPHLAAPWLKPVLSSLRYPVHVDDRQGPDPTVRGNAMAVFIPYCQRLFAPATLAQQIHVYRRYGCLLVLIGE